MKDLLITLLNTAFWFGLHFGTAGAVCALRRTCRRNGSTQTGVFSRFPTGKCGFSARSVCRNGRTGCRSSIPNLTSGTSNPGRDTAYLDRFLFITCRAEVIHYVIGVLGWVSLVFCLLSADRTAWLIRYAVIALAIQLANLPFAWIQRYNRKRLLSVRKRLSLRIEI